MKPYYRDKLITIYHADSSEAKSKEADVLVLDPALLPEKMEFGGKIIYIFCGGNSWYYRRFFHDDRPIREHNWKGAVYDPETKDYTVRRDNILVIGEVTLPESKIYNIEVISKRYHKWERPVGLLHDLLVWTEGDILDPFLGSGTTAVVAKSLGRKCVGYEIEEKMCEIVADRLRGMK